MRGSRNNREFDVSITTLQFYVRRDARALFVVSDHSLLCRRVCSHLGPAASSVGRPIPLHHLGNSAAPSDEVGVGCVNIRQLQLQTRATGLR